MVLEESKTTLCYVGSHQNVITVLPNAHWVFSTHNGRREYVQLNAFGLNITYI